MSADHNQSPAEGDAGLTDEQANALAAFYDVSPGTVRDIYALSKPKAAPNPQPKGTALAEALRRLLKGNEWKELQGEWAWHTKSMPGNADLTLAREALEAHDAQSPAPSLPKGTAVDLTDDDIITELHRHTQRYTDDRLDYIIDPSEAVAFARAAIAADRALQATAPAMHSTALAGLILTHLGYSTEPSLEPGADMRRDALARRLGEWLSPATQAPAPAPGAPAGMALVPVEPTTEMQVAGFESEAWDALSSAVLAKKGWPYTCRQSAECVSAIYRAMLAAKGNVPVHSTGDGNA